MESYSSVAIDAKNTSIASHVLGDIRPTMPEKNVDTCLNTPKITNKKRKTIDGIKLHFHALIDESEVVGSLRVTE